MTDAQINQSIAEACGWTEISSDGVVGRAPGETCNRVMFCPLYCTNLNAMHEAEKSLKGYEQIHSYVWHLNNRKDWETDHKLMEVHISARDRAEAFLRTLGKWEEVQG